DVVLYRDTNQHEPELLSVNEYLQEFLPANLRLRERQPHDRSSESVWVLVLCSASYCCRGPLNHWAPGWWREQLGDDEFLRLHEEAFSSLTERITEARLRCDLARIDYADCEEEQRDVAMATVITWQEEMQRLDNLREFRQRMLRAGIFVQESRADGSCLLWSLRALTRNDPQLEDESEEARQEQLDLRIAARRNISGLQTCEG
ncbi:unnamed protein product, partial [Symbiodinium sp. CCMP2456]